MTTILLFASLRAGVHLKPGQAPTSAPVWAIVMQLILPPYNALYYGKQAVANYAVHYMLHLLGEDDLIKKRIEERDLGDERARRSSRGRTRWPSRSAARRERRARVHVCTPRASRQMFICAVESGSCAAAASMGRATWRRAGERVVYETRNTPPHAAAADGDVQVAVGTATAA